MNKPTPLSKPICSPVTANVEGFDSLVELALDLRWSWNHATDEVWRPLDPELWEFTQNPWVVLQTVSTDKLQRVLANSAFRKNMDDRLRAKREAAEKPAWLQENHPQSRLNSMAEMIGFQSNLDSI